MNKTLCTAVLLGFLLTTGLEAQETRPPDRQLAQLTLPTGAGADWRQWDSFLTNVVKKLATGPPGVAARPAA